MPIRVFHAEDNDAFRRLIREILTDDEIQVVGEAYDCDGLVAGVAEHRPDVVLVDQLCDAPTVARLRADRPGLRVVVLSGHAPEDGDPALAAAADGYVVKGADLDEIRAAVRG